MNWTALLKGSIEQTYKATEDLMDLVDEDGLDWKPATGSNWMTTGQLLKHITTACGFCCRGFVTGDWGMPEGASSDDMPAEDMLPKAEQMPTVASVAEAKRLLAEDKRLALEMVDASGEEKLANQMVSAPWNPMEMLLGHRLFEMVGHLNQHKGQLFYYLKLQGKPVHTGSLWGM
jgi:uncharacterized damage-inducible protein DinB